MMGMLTAWKWTGSTDRLCSSRCSRIPIDLLFITPRRIPFGERGLCHYSTEEASEDQFGWGISEESKTNTVIVYLPTRVTVLARMQKCWSPTLADSPPPCQQYRGYIHPHHVTCIYNMDSYGYLPTAKATSSELIGDPLIIKGKNPKFMSEIDRDYSKNGRWCIASSGIASAGWTASQYKTTVQ